MPGTECSHSSPSEEGVEDISGVLLLLPLVLGVAENEGGEDEDDEDDVVDEDDDAEEGGKWPPEEESV
jgi:hypothetical protein